MVRTHDQLCLKCQQEIFWEAEMEPVDTCPHCSKPLADYWSYQLKETRGEPFTPETFAKALDVLEMMPYQDVASSVKAVKHALETAGRLGIEHLKMRVLLVQADVMGRQGEIAEGGRMLMEVKDWAIVHRNAYVLSRSHRLLTGFFRRIGDMAGAFEHAVRAVEQTPPDVPPRIKADHLMILALMLDETGAYESASYRFQEVMEIASEVQDSQLALNTLNNMAFTRYEQGDAVKAMELVDQMKEVAGQYHLPLGAHQLDTIARTLMLLGLAEQAENTLRPAIENPEGRMLAEISALPESMITYAEAHRAQGAFDRAQSTMDKARELCDKYGLSGLKVRVKLEQCNIYAAQGRYKEAFDMHREYHAEAETLRANEMQARTRILQAVFDAEEARRVSEQYREMALRDPLTGLHNRRFIDAHIDTLLERASATGEHITVMMIDLDHFKVINDTLSHAVGDQVLLNIAKLLTSAVAETAAVSRFGGEEFVVVLSGTDEREGHACAERIRNSICSADWKEITGDLRITASIGASTAAGGRTTRFTLLSQADVNLYTAKRAGRNRVVSSGV
ncbi:tetratricopeptide repeat-containing diguanylate cyclase [Paenibacillus gansuensis]|uniref:Diguanylate cyclase n=1 Tax=Paenibacillus gansuensis TaxID=306542 RepID=A0ABW5P857_9BACL